MKNLSNLVFSKTFKDKKELKFLPKQLLIKGNIDDCANFYYKPIIGYFFRKRLIMARRLLDNCNFNNLLEIGYGSGIFLPVLKNYSQNLYGVDIHELHTQVSTRLKQISINAHLSVGSVTSLPYSDNFFDCIVCISVLEHIHDLKSSREEIYRVLRPEGIAVIGFPVKNFLTDFGFNLVGFNPKGRHITRHSEILKDFSKKLVLEEIIKFPPLMPLNLCLYIACKFVKRGLNSPR